jgi:anti-sigma regulatory factor (Ser/Thr protein kinase)
MSMLSVLLRALRFAYHTPTLLLVALEENLRPTLPRGAFVMMLYGVLDPTTGRVTFACAGHTPVLVYRAASRSVEWRYGRAVPIGAVGGDALARMLCDETIDLEPGDLMVNFTDGYNETMREGMGDQLGLPRMGEIVTRHAPSGPRAVIDALAAAMRDGSQSDVPLDDETLLIVGYTGPAIVLRTGSVAGSDAVARAETAAPLVVLAAARRAGAPLTLAADLAQLVEIRGWIAACADLRDLDARSARLLESALYEVSANVVEHGYRDRAGATFDLWWAPGRTASEPPTDPAAAARERVRTGCFVVQDRGVPFQPPHQSFLDFADPRVRRRGRGIGLHMVRRILDSIHYHPGTAEGNLTLMVFDPDRAGQT